MIDEPRRGPGRPRKIEEPKDTVEVRVKRGYFRDFGPKCLPGQIITVPVDEAAVMVAKGIGERL